ncbi:MAG: hypothetical protein KAU28_07135 [Phycisphaerae bacterium]|nr:hypothetical protein [Phycisphaerae bacterium]
MATFKLNVARIRGCPAPKELAKALEVFGLPEGDAFGVLNHSVSEQAVFAAVVHKTLSTVQQLDADNREITSTPVEKVSVYPFAVKPSSEVLEIYAGAASAIKQLGMFFSSRLALPTIVEPIELDIPATLAKLASATERFQLRSIRVSDYAHSSYMSGPYAPKFLDTAHGMDFLTEYAEFVTAAAVRFAGPTGHVNVKLTPKANFSFSCAEDDQPTVQAILRKVI